ncbi:hypothetical protein FOMPIDRAFT_1150831 [Fomitopsis schrenkii]|uniref:Uncharacterized protein n=1 Tax=Fomitopsis schrenkii TaxID=2126942 RepID=S8F478_FOMSC|nr:hypothetical protein FOMPIDRAFT_1150831 [Fomitopsis schrenkii]
MHLVWENLLPNLVSLWTGEFKGLELNNEPFVIEKTVWEAIGTACKASGQTIPSAFGAAVPNIATEAALFTAETWSLFAQHLGPIILRRSFRREHFYAHFIELIRLLNICLQFEITSAEILDVEAGFIDWVREYEQLYYQHKAEYLSMCPLTVHALLHVVPSMRATGPVWASWEFPMERFCGTLLPAVKSRRFPYASLSNYATELAQMKQISLIYNLEDVLSLRTRAPQEEITQYANHGYLKAILLAPKRMGSITTQRRNQIIKCLATRYDGHAATIRRLLPTELEQWGKVRISGGGDTMNAAELVRVGEGHRDASYVRYTQQTDRLAHRRNLPPDFRTEDFYGRLLAIYVVPMKPSLDLGTQTDEILLLAAIQSLKIVRVPNIDIPFYKYEGNIEVVDLNTIQCVVGRAKQPQGGWWGIIDRSGPLAEAVFVD